MWLLRDFILQVCFIQYQLLDVECFSSYPFSVLTHVVHKNCQQCSFELAWPTSCSFVLVEEITLSLVDTHVMGEMRGWSEQWNWTPTTSYMFHWCTCKRVELQLHHWNEHHGSFFYSCHNVSLFPLSGLSHSRGDIGQKDIYNNLFFEIYWLILHRTVVHCIFI